MLGRVIRHEKDLGRKNILNKKIEAVTFSKKRLDWVLRKRYQEFFDDCIDGLYYYDYYQIPPQKHIILSFYTTSMQAIIHEINHTLCMQFLAMDKDMVYAIEAFLNTPMIELINEITSIEITKIFQDLGGKLLDKEFCVEGKYRDNFYLIKDFYYSFIDLIKEAIISANPKLLEVKLGDKNLYSFCSLVSKCYKNEISLYDFKRLKLLLACMKKHLAKEQDYDYESYFKELEEQGCRVRRL